MQLILFYYACKVIGVILALTKLLTLPVPLVIDIIPIIICERICEKGPF